MKIKIGKKYLNANGDIVSIVSITSKGSIGNMFYDKSGLSYQEDGHYRYDKTPSKFDLIKKVSKKNHKKILKILLMD